MRIIRKVIVHCSDSDIESHDNLETIKEWHIARGFVDTGYHYVITKDGVCHPARNLWVSGAHCLHHNRDSIGICLTGKYSFSTEQFQKLQFVWHNLKEVFVLSDNDILAHNMLNPNKTCPNFDLGAALSNYLG